MGWCGIVYEFPVYPIDDCVLTIYTYHVLTMGRHGISKHESKKVIIKLEFKSFVDI